MANGHDDGSDVVTSLETNSVARALLSFQGPHRVCSEGLSAQAGLAPKATIEYNGRRLAGRRRQPVSFTRSRLCLRLPT